MTSASAPSAKARADNIRCAACAMLLYYRPPCTNPGCANYQQCGSQPAAKPAVRAPSQGPQRVDWDMGWYFSRHRRHRPGFGRAFDWPDD